MLHVIASYQPLKSKGLTKETCERWQYGIGDVQGVKAQIATYVGKTEPVAQAVRLASGNTELVGDFPSAQLFGQNLWRSHHRRQLVVCQSEVEAMAVDQAMNKTIPVVAVHSLETAEASLKANLLDLEQYERVVFAFTDTEAGIKLAQLLAPGKAYIAYPEKPFTELLAGAAVAYIQQTIENAVPFKVSGVVRGEDMAKIVSKPVIPSSIKYPWEGLTDFLLGYRRGEIGVIVGPPKQGKTTLLAEIAYCLAMQGEKVGVMFLEDNIQEAGLKLLGIQQNKKLFQSTQGYSEEQLEKLSNDVLAGRFQFYDRSTPLDMQGMFSTIRYFAKGLGCTCIVLDPLSYFVMGNRDRRLDERQTIDSIMYALTKVVAECGCTIIMGHHTSAPEGKAHEEGGQIGSNDVRGSKGVAMACNWMLAAERDQQGDTPNKVWLRVLANRHGSKTGPCGVLEYNYDTGRLTECPFQDKPQPQRKGKRQEPKPVDKDNSRPSWVQPHDAPLYKGEPTQDIPF